MEFDDNDVDFQQQESEELEEAFADSYNDDERDALEEDNNLKVVVQVSKKIPSPPEHKHNPVSDCKAGEKYDGARKRLRKLSEKKRNKKRKIVVEVDDEIIDNNHNNDMDIPNTTSTYTTDETDTSTEKADSASVEEESDIEYIDEEPSWTGIIFYLKMYIKFQYLL